MNRCPDRVRIALSLLDPAFYQFFLGRTALAQKTRALVMHDRTLNRAPHRYVQQEFNQ